MMDESYTRRAIPQVVSLRSREKAWMWWKMQENHGFLGILGILSIAVS